MAFTAYKQLTIDHLQCGSGNSTDWPLAVVRVADADLKDTSNGGLCRPDGFDLRPYNGLISGGGTAMTFELVSYDGSVGTLEMHVKIPTLSVSSDVVLYLYFGDASLSSNASSSGTWNSNYLVVHHLKGTPFADSTANARPTTNSGSVTATTGNLGQGASFGGTDQALLLDARDSTPAITYEAWVKGTAWTNPYTGVIGHFYSGGSFQSLLIKSNGKLACYVAATTTISYDGTGTTLSTGVWYHLALTYDSTNGLKGYINGVVDGTAAANGNLRGDYDLPTTPSTQTAIGNDTNSLTARDLNGVLDEARIASAALSSSWILADYNNQKPSSTFLTWGTLTLLPITGALTQTFGPLTVASTGTVSVAGTLTSTFGALTLSATGVVTTGIVGALTQTLGPLTLSATGTVATTGSLVSTFGALTLSATGTVTTLTVTGSLTATLGALILSSTATVTITGTLARTLAPLTLIGIGRLSTATTLADLQLLMAQRWDGVVFWTDEEARLAINEAFSEWNLLTGYWRTRVLLSVNASDPEIALPGLLVYGMRVATAAGLPLIPTSLSELDLGQPSWRLETTASGGAVPTRPLLWAPVSLTRIAIWPTYPTSSPSALSADGVMTTPVLLLPADGADVGEEILDILADMALHIVAFKEAGARWRATRPYYEAFLQAAAEENSRLKQHQAFRRWAGLDRRRDFQPTKGAQNQMSGVASQFSRHDQPEGGG